MKINELVHKLTKNSHVHSIRSISSWSSSYFEIRKCSCTDHTK